VDQVLDYRAQALSELSNVEVFRQSPMTAAEIGESGFEHIAVATGSTWRRDGVARWHTLSIGVAAGADHVAHMNVYTGATAELAADSVLMVTSRLPEKSLLTELTQALADRGPTAVRGIGDAWAPGTIAAAVWSGRRFAEEFDADLPPGDEVPFRREVTGLAPIPPRPA
jgi:hypothetical protein